MMLALWLLWAIILLLSYYRQVSILLMGDEFAWQVLQQDILASRGVWLLWAIFVLGGLILSWWLARGARTRRRFSSVRSTLIASLLPVALGLAVGGHGLLPLLRPVIGAVLTLTATTLLGNAIVLRLRWQPESWYEQLLFAFTTGMAVLSTILLSLALLGLYRPLVVIATIALVLMISAGDWVFWPRPLWQRVTFSRPLMISLNVPVLLFAIVSLAMSLALIGALAPEVEYDALWYHLWLPDTWLEQGRTVDIVSEYISLYPGGLEMVYGAALALGGPVAAKLIHFACLPLSALMVYLLARRFLPVRLAWMAVALFVTIPTVLWEATTAYVDLALALPVGLSVYAALQYADKRHPIWFFLTAVNLALALSIKHLAIFVLLLVAGGLLLRLWLDDRLLLRSMLLVAGLVALSLLMPLPWYLRSWRASGNPFFPDLYGIFGAFPPERWSQFSEGGLKAFKDHFGRPHTLLNLLTLPWDLTVHAWRYGGTFGPLLALFSPGLLLPHRLDGASLLTTGNAEKRDLRWLAAFCLLYFSLWASPVSSFQFRFLLPIASLLAVLAAVGLEHIWQIVKHRWASSLLVGFISILLLLNLPPLTALHEGDRASWENWLTHVMRRPPLAVVVGHEAQDDYLGRLVSSYAAWQYINTHLPEDAFVLTFSGGDHLYSQRSRLSSDSTLSHPVVWGALVGQETQALQALRTLGISHILFDKHQADTTWELAIVQPELVADHYTLEYDDGRFLLYRLSLGEEP